MKKIENLNCMKKTVLKLEKEISAISNNLSKVKKKDHTTMKKMIHNINYLLTKEPSHNNIYLNDINNVEENKNIEEFQNIKKNHYILHTDESNIDYILIPLNEFNNKSKIELNQDNPYNTYINKKNYSYSKIRNNRAISESKAQNYKKYNNEYNNKNMNKIFNENAKYSNRNSIIDNNNINNRNNYSNNKEFNRTNQIAYSKPRLMSEKIKTNVKNNKRIIHNKNNNINNNINISTQNEGKRNENEKSSINSLKYLTYNHKINYNNQENKNSDNINDIYFNNKQNKNEDFYNNTYLKENKYNGKYIYNKKDLNNKEKLNNNYIKKEDSKINKDEYNRKSEKDIFLSIKNDKKLVFEKRAKRNKMSKLDANSKSSNSFNINKINNYMDNKENKKNIINYNYIIDKKKQYLSDNNEIEINTSDKENKKGYDNYINPQENKKKQRINNDEINDNNINICKDSNIYNNKDIIKINKLLKLLDVKNINDALYKVNILLKYEKSLNKIKNLYNDGNNKNKLDDDLIWLSNIIKKYKKNEIYKKYCKTIMIKNKIKNFDEFKNFINNILVKNRKNKGFIVDVKNILCEDEYYSNNKNLISINQQNHETNKMKIEKNNKGNNTDNSNDIKFNQDEHNNKMNNKYIMNTYD